MDFQGVVPEVGGGVGVVMEWQVYLVVKMEMVMGY